MAKFHFEIIKLGYEGKKIESTVALRGISFNEDDEIVIIPSEYNGLPVTHIGYRQGGNPAHMRFHDWHHPSQGDGDWMPKKYIATSSFYINIPPRVKKIVFPKTMTHICFNLFCPSADITYAIEEGNVECEIQDNKVVYIN